MRPCLLRYGMPSAESCRIAFRGNDGSQQHIRPRPQGSPEPLVLRRVPAMPWYTAENKGPRRSLRLGSYALPKTVTAMKSDAATPLKLQPCDRTPPGPTDFHITRYEKNHKGVAPGPTSARTCLGGPLKCLKACATVSRAHAIIPRQIIQAHNRPAPPKSIPFGAS